MIRLRDLIVYCLDSLTLWLDDLSARWAVQSGKPVPPDVLERRARIGATRRRF